MNSGKKGGVGCGAMPLMGMSLALALLVVGLDAAFQLSKVSFFTRLGAFQTLRVVLNSAVLIIVPFIISVFAFKAVFLMPRLNRRPGGEAGVSLLFFISVVFIAFVHIDTWTYSAFGLNVSDLPRWAGPALGIFLLFSGIALFKAFGAAAYGFFSSYGKAAAAACVFLFVFPSVSFLYGPGDFYSPEGGAAQAGGAARRPNIIFFSSDGLDAERMSLYGYRRQTTPAIDRLAERSILYTKAFAQSGNSRGSVASLMTGKSPFTTKVIYPPDILLDRESFEHLPGILSEMGYYTVDVGDRMFVSPSRYNLRHGFHNENGVETGFSKMGRRVSWFIREMNLEFYFLGEILRRYADRAGHLAGLSEELSYHRRLLQSLGVDVKGGHAMNAGMFSKSDDFKRISFVLEKIRTEERPLFIHIHLLGTHGPRYEQNLARTFSAGKKEVGDNDPDFYDDAVLTVDYYLHKIVSGLSEAGKLKDTMIVVHTDHGSGQSAAEAVPLVVHLPGQKKGVAVDTPVQYMDIAPSVLKYLGLRPPEWMEGAVIFPTIDVMALKERPIFMADASVGYREIKGGAGNILEKKSLGPPFYGVKRASVLKKDLIYILDLEEGAEHMLDISVNRFSPPETDGGGLKPLYREILLRHLKGKGFDVSALRFK